MWDSDFDSPGGHRMAVAVDVEGKVGEALSSGYALARCHIYGGAADGRRWGVVVALRFARCPAYKGIRVVLGNTEGQDFQQGMN
jgi:hypothetical protein